MECRCAKGEYPARLYHRTTHDAAFSILETGFQPGYGNSGKIHSYFAKATLSELDNRAGSRANLPYELVISTDMRTCSRPPPRVSSLETLSRGAASFMCVTPRRARSSGPGPTPTMRKRSSPPMRPRKPSSKTLKRTMGFSRYSRVSQWGIRFRV